MHCSSGAQVYTNPHATRVTASNIRKLQEVFNYMLPANTSTGLFVAAKSLIRALFDAISV